MIAVVVSAPAAEMLATDRGTDRRAGALVRLVGPTLDVVYGEGGGYAVVPGRGQVVRGSRQYVRGPDQAPGGIGEDLHVHPIRLERLTAQDPLSIHDIAGRAGLVDLGNPLARGRCRVIS